MDICQDKACDQFRTIKRIPLSDYDIRDIGLAEKAIMPEYQIDKKWDQMKKMSTLEAKVFFSQGSCVEKEKGTDQKIRRLDYDL